MRPFIARHLRLSLILFGAVVLFTVNLGSYDLWPPDEPRFAQVSREMVERGDYLSPYINGEPYKEKPPLLFWSIALVSRAFGDVTETAARLPSAIAGVLTVLLTYLLSRQLFGERVAIWTAIILATTQRFWWQSRVGQIDMLLTLCVTASLLLFWNWHVGRRRATLVGFYAAVTAGMLAKGPPALIFPLLMIVAFYWKDKTSRKQMHLMGGFGGVLAATAIWLIPARMAVATATTGDATSDITANLFRQTIGRFLLGVAHAQPPWFYFEKLPVDLLPWSLFLPFVALWTWRNRREGQEMRILFCWCIPAFIFFSVCVGKRSIYLMPLLPVFAMLEARAILALIDGDHARWRKRTAIVWAAALFFIAAAPIAVLFSGYRDAWNYGFLVLTAIALSGAAFVVVSSHQTDGRALPGAVGGVFAALALGISLIVMPAVNEYKSAKTFCAPLRSLSDSGEDFAIYSVGFSREEYIYYAKHPHVPILGGTFDLEQLENIGSIESARQQNKMLRAAQKSVEEVPISSFASITDGEFDALTEGLENSADASAWELDSLERYRRAVGGILEKFTNDVMSPKPAFVIATEQDWRWVLPLEPRVRSLHLLEHRNVGSRSVMLFANDEGKLRANARRIDWHEATNPTIPDAHLYTVRNEYSRTAGSDRSETNELD